MRSRHTLGHRWRRPDVKWDAQPDRIDRRYGDLDLGRVMTWLRERLPDDAIVTSDAGNFSGWPNRFLQYRRPGRQLGPTSGAMGYGVPAAVAAVLVLISRDIGRRCYLTAARASSMTPSDIAIASLTS